MSIVDHRTNEVPALMSRLHNRHNLLRSTRQSLCQPKSTWNGSHRSRILPVTTRSSKRHVSIHYINTPSNVKPKDGGGGAGYPREIDAASFFLGGDFDIRVLPWGRVFHIATTCFRQKVVPRGGNLTFSRYPGVGNLTLALVKMSNSPGSARPPQPWGLTLIGA